MKKLGNSGEFKKVYLNCSATVSGPKELAGPIGKYFDKEWYSIRKIRWTKIYGKSCTAKHK